MSKGEKSMNLDPMRLWREWYQKSEKSWNDMVMHMLGEDQVAKSTGKYVQEAIHAQRMFTETMAKWLANLNLPSRSDVIALSDRVGKLEDAIAGLQAEVGQLRRAMTGHETMNGATTRPLRPRRTKTPPKQE